MTTLLAPLAPEAAHQRLAAGTARLIDIRDPDEFARRHVPGAELHPLAGISAAALSGDPRPLIFTCKSGMRTGTNQALLAKLAPGSFVLEGGIDDWAAAGLPIAKQSGAPLEIMRQVQIGAGSLVLLGVLLAVLVSPGFIVLSGLVGAGLMMAGITGFCGMARLLALMPWNRPAAG